MHDLKSGKPANIDVTPDLQYLIIAFHATKYGILKISLGDYFHMFPSHRHSNSNARQHSMTTGRDGDIIRDEDEVDLLRGKSSVDKIGTPGNRSWRNLLLSANEMVSRRSVDKTNSVWKAIEQSGKNLNWFDEIQDVQPPARQDPHHDVQRTKRCIPPHQDCQVTTGLKKRKVSKEDPMWARSTTLNVTEDERTNPSYIFKIPKAYRENCTVGGVCSASRSAMVWYRCDADITKTTDVEGQRYGGVCIVDMENNLIHSHRLVYRLFCYSVELNAAIALVDTKTII